MKTHPLPIPSPLEAEPILVTPVSSADSMHLYPVRPWLGTDFSGEKETTMPNDSMSLEDIITRFIKNQSLPVGHDVHYNDLHDYLDLEKLEHLDPVDKDEVLHELRQKIRDMRIQLRLDDDNNELPPIQSEPGTPT